MDRSLEFLTGDVMATHWGEQGGGIATLAVKKKATPKPKKKPRPKPTKSGPGCATEVGKKSCTVKC